ncbi:MAG: hypothetical protein KME28_08870 [Pelatocladus maniniholoensis HA4357-MV3]|jgi:hypothetical protein|uniref:Spore coat protein U domain-containing protein n=1 Tax=Pelatocladus maniniholoensis HA4357-MV3 TaxID=1117104 RepID=A0A9E3H6F5_9NOST|nr:hypothetical protein [Pelatocladus maniniholoensis HA4357-MV3]BAZ68274.1 hypothetical protein NIES4106_30350 [Fischerella sp. NIES-4106]
MIRQIVIASAFVLGSCIAIAPKAFAGGTVNVPFGGAVTAACSFSGSPGSGTLANPTPYSLSSLLGGSPGSASVQCTGATGNLTITGVTKTAGPSLTSPTYTATAIGGAVNVAYAAGASTPGIVLPGLAVPLTVNMDVVDTAALPAGTYAFTVDMTVTP